MHGDERVRHRGPEVCNNFNNSKGCSRVNYVYKHAKINTSYTANPDNNDCTKRMATD